ESRDVLADEVQVGWPPRLVALLVGAVADARDVVEQRVEPDVDRELRIKRNSDAPRLARARDVDVAQLRPDERQHFIAARLRLDEVGVGLVERQQLILERRQPKEVARLAALDRRRLVVGTAFVLVQLLLGLERLAALAVPALIAAL